MQRQSQILNPHGLLSNSGRSFFHDFLRGAHPSFGLSQLDPEAADLLSCGHQLLIQAEIVGLPVLLLTSKSRGSRSEPDCEESGQRHLLVTVGVLRCSWGLVRWSIRVNEVHGARSGRRLLMPTRPPMVLSVVRLLGADCDPEPVWVALSGVRHAYSRALG
jgi:hypothetical protein